MEEIDPVKTMVMNPVAGWAYMREEMIGTPAGTRTVEGYPCELVEYRETGKDYVAFRVWESKQLVFNVKVVSYATNGNATMALRNIKEGPVDDARFSIPSGYTKIGATGGTGERLSKRSDEEKKTSASGNLVFILDASGSMWGQVRARPRLPSQRRFSPNWSRSCPMMPLSGWWHTATGARGTATMLRS